MEEALNIPEVLEAVMEKLDRKSLLECRLVNRAWNKEANNILQHQVIVQLQNTSDLKSFARTCALFIPHISIRFQTLEIYSRRRSSCRSPSAPIQLEDIQDFLQITPTTHHVKTLGLYFLSSVSLEPQQIFLMIHNHFPNLEALEIEINAKFIEAASDFQAVEQLSLKMYKLKTVSVFLSNGDAVPTERLHVISWFIRTLVSSAVNLQSVKLMGMESNNYREEIISSLLSPHLREIKLHNVWVSPENLDALSTKDFPLSVVHLLDIDPNKVETLHFKKFLSRYSSSIQELALDFSKKCQPACLPFPFDVHLKNLRSLLLNGLRNGAWIDWSKLPQLKQLKVYNSCIQQISASVSAYPRHCHLEMVDIFNIVKPALIPLIRQLAPLLHPQLTALYLVSLRDVIPVLAVIFKECTRLKCLESWDNQDHYNSLVATDQVLCGVGDLQMTGEIRPNEGAVWDQGDADLTWRTGRPSTCNAPYIGDLKELQNLKLHGNFSEVSLLYGIVHCPSLKDLELKSDSIRVKTSARIIRQARLVHLISAKINDVLINHLREA